MPGCPADKAERIELVLGWLAEMKPRTQILKELQDAGITSATASRTLKAAEEQLVRTISTVDRQALMSQMVEMLMDAARMARDQKNPTGVSACIAQLAKITRIAS
jgi:hypothetical protein